MSFAAPAFLWGLAALSVPIVLHLVQRWRFRQVRWAMMWLLSEAHARRRRTVKLKDRLLLLVRLALLLCLVAAFAGPSLRVSAGGPLAWLFPTTTAVLVDVSASMSVVEGDGDSRIDKAREQARQTLRDLGDKRAELWVFADALVPAAELSEGPAHTLLDAVDAIEVTDGGTDITGALLHLEQRLQAGDQTIDEIVLIGDAQASGWRDRSLAARERLRDLAQTATLRVIDVAGERDVPNVSITRLALSGQPLATPEAPTRLLAEVASSGWAGEVRLRVLVDGQLAAERSVPLTLGARAEVQLDVGTLAVGLHEVEARIDGDRLPVDDRRQLVVDVVADHPILFVDGPAIAGASRAVAASIFLSTFLAPTADPGERGQFVFRPRSVALHDLVNALAIEDVPIVVLADVPELPQDVIDALEGWIDRGGSLVVFPGPATRVDTYNERLFRDGWGPLPAAFGALLGQPMVELTDARSCRLLDPTSVAPALRRETEAAAWRAALLDLRVARRYDLTLGNEGQPRVLARFDDGAPFLVERSWGSGRVVLCATSCDHRWSNLPVSPALALVDHLLTGLLSERLAHPSIPVGGAIVLPLADEASQPTAEELLLSGPGGITVELELRRDARGTPLLASPPLQRAGFYRHANGQLWSVHVDRDEGSLACLAPDADVWPGADSDLEDEVDGTAPGATSGTASGTAPGTAPGAESVTAPGDESVVESGVASRTEPEATPGATPNASLEGSSDLSRDVPLARLLLAFACALALAETLLAGRLAPPLS